MENNENNGINNQNTEVTNIPNKINNMENSMTNPSSVVNIEENRTLNSETNTINNNEVLNNVSSVNTNNENITQNDIQNVNNDMVSSSSVNNFDSNSITPNNVQSMNNINTNNTIENHNSVPNNPNINAKQNDDFMIKKEKKIWPIILIVVILLIVGLVCGYYFIVMSLKNILSKAIDNMYSKVDKIYKSINENKNKETSLKGVTEGNLIITTKSLNINGSANYYLGYDVSDENNIKAYLETSVKYNNAEPVNGTVYLEKDIVYILVKEIYNKALGISLKSAMTDKTCNDSTQTDCIPESSIIKPNEIFKEENKLDISVDDVKHITDLNKELLKKSINYDKVTKSIKTDSGIYFETVYNFDSEEQDNVNKEIINSLKNDDKTLEILAKMYGTTKEEVKKSFDSMDASMGSVK